MTDIFRVAATELDEVFDSADGLDHEQLVETVMAILRGFLGTETDPTIDVSLLVALIINRAGTLADDVTFGDRTLADRLQGRINQLFDEPILRSRLDIELDGIAATPHGPSPRLEELCASGIADYPHLHRDSTGSARIVALAENRHDTAALLAAVDPTGNRRAQLGHHRPIAVSVHDSLARLARSDHEPTARAAIDALVNLCTHPATTVDAALRLPPERLGPEHINQILEAAERHQERVDHDTATKAMLLPPRTLQAVLWLAADARSADQLHDTWNWILG